MASKEKLTEINTAVDKMQEIARKACAPYSLEELMKMLNEGKNPLLGDKP